MDTDDVEDFAPLGKYLPRAFSITMLHPAIGAAPMAGLLQIPQAAFPTFLHEFGHLVQDWSTFRGVIDFLNLWDQVRMVADYVRRSGSAVPFPLVDPRTGHHRLPLRMRFGAELDALRQMTEPRIDWTNKGRHWRYEAIPVYIRSPGVTCW